MGSFSFCFGIIFIDGLSDYLYYFLKRSAKIIDSSASGTTFKEVSGAVVSQIKTPLPPLAEQKRIVSKVDELMALCDQLESQTEASIEAHQLLVKTLLETLTNAKDADELNDSWQRISEHFDVLFTTEDSIDQLKQTILQLAVMGKLVKQDPNDEPASELLRKIATEKAKLIKEGKIKKQKPLPPVSEGEKLFELPEGWEWCRFQSLFYDLKYGTSKRSDYTIAGAPVLRIPNVVKGYIDSVDLKFTKLNDNEFRDLSLKENDILVIRSNGSSSIVGSSAVVDKRHEKFAYAGYLVRVRLDNDLYNSKFIQLVLRARLIREQIETPLRTTSGVKNINSTEISRLIMPCVPFEQQKRIVAKVDELMSYCDTLKVHIHAAQSAQFQLADAIAGRGID